MFVLFIPLRNDNRLFNLQSRNIEKSFEKGT